MADPTQEEKDAAAAKEAADKTAAEEAAAKTAEEEAAAKAAADKAKEELGEGGKAALDAERKARKDAEKRAKDAEAKVKAAEDEKLSETERLKKEADESKATASGATDKLRRANLLSALIDAGVGKAKAASRLLDGVKYDDDDEPTNLDDAIKAAKTEYGDDLFKAVKAKPTDPNGGDGNEEKDPPSLSAEELEMAKSFGMTPTEYAEFKDPQHQGPAKEPAKT